MRICDRGGVAQTSTPTVGKPKAEEVVNSCCEMTDAINNV